MSEKIERINRTIREMCTVLQRHVSAANDWSLLSEEDLLREMTVCLFSSQMIFEVAVAAADRLGDVCLLSPAEFLGSQESAYEEKLRLALSKPLSVMMGGCERQVLPRFRNRNVSLLTSTFAMLYGGGRPLKTILHSSKSAREARASLVASIKGFGPKQASLFLRRVSFSSDLAVIDRHVLSYLSLCKGIRPSAAMLSRLASYECIETVFSDVAAEFGQKMGCFDLAVWITMRVAKREGVI